MSPKLSNLIEAVFSKAQLRAERGMPDPDRFPRRLSGATIRPS